MAYSASFNSCSANELQHCSDSFYGTGIILGITHVDFSNSNVYDTPNHNQSIKGIPCINKVVLQENNREKLQKEPVRTNLHPLTHPHLFYLNEQK